MFATLLAHALDGFLSWDHALKKPLKRYIPNLEALLTNPRQVLGEGPLIIGPSRFYGTATLMGMTLSAFVWIVACAGILNLKEPNPALGMAVLAVCVVSPPLFLTILLRVCRGGECRLTTGGVVFSYRSRLAFCPWRVFDSSDEPDIRGEDRAWVLANPEAIPDVVMWKNERLSEEEFQLRKEWPVLASGRDVNCGQLRFDKTGAWIILPDLYAVNIRKVSELLVRVGRTLAAQPLHETPNLTTRERTR
jgi:hypothetical protein